MKDTTAQKAGRWIGELLSMALLVFVSVSVLVGLGRVYYWTVTDFAFRGTLQAVVVVGLHALCGFSAQSYLSRARHRAVEHDEWLEGLIRPKRRRGAGPNGSS